MFRQHVKVSPSRTPSIPKIRQPEPSPPVQGGHCTARTGPWISIHPFLPRAANAGSNPPASALRMPSFFIPLASIGRIGRAHVPDRLPLLFVSSGMHGRGVASRMRGGARAVEDAESCVAAIFLEYLRTAGYVMKRVEACGLYARGR